MSLSRILYYDLSLNRNLNNDRPSILKQQGAAFRRLLKYAFRRSAFYRTYYADHGIGVEDLENIRMDQLPTIDKETMMDHFDDIAVPGKLTRARVEGFLEFSPAPESISLSSGVITSS